MTAEDRPFDEVVAPPMVETVHEEIESPTESTDFETVEVLTTTIEPEELPENRRRKRRSSATVD